MHCRKHRDYNVCTTCVSASAREIFRKYVADGTDFVCETMRGGTMKGGPESKRETTLIPPCNIILARESFHGVPLVENTRARVFPFSCDLAKLLQPRTRNGNLFPTT